MGDFFGKSVFASNGMEHVVHVSNEVGCSMFSSQVMAAVAYVSLPNQKAAWDTISCVLLCNDLQGHSLYMRGGPLVLALPRRRAYTGHVIDARPLREERDL